ncbi:MAG: stress responsive protein [Acidimicrobiia bacterium]
MIRVTAFVHHDAARGDDVLAAVRRAGAEQAAPTEAAAHRAGQTMAFGVFAHVDEARSFAGAVQSSVTGLASHVEVVRYAQGPVRVRRPELAGIQRTLLLHVGEGADAAEVATFERHLADMGRYVAAIRNSSLSRVDEVRGATGPPWTHVWEQEFDTLEDLTGPYMDHAQHFGFVDTWFDPQAPNHIVDTTLVHGMCRLERSILARASRPPARDAAPPMERTSGRAVRRRSRPANDPG